LGAGPKTVIELRSIAARLRLKYQSQLERRISRALGHQDSIERDSQQQGVVHMTPPPLKDVLGKAGGAAGAVAGAAGALAGGFFSKVKTGAAALGGLSHQLGRNTETTSSFPEPAPTMVDLPPLPTAPVSELKDSAEEDDGKGKDIAPATEAISNFSIGDDEEDDFL
jgi:hypothetical protein